MPPRKRTVPKKAPAKPETALDNTREALLAQQAELALEMERCQRKIEVIPKLKEQRDKLRREALVNRAQRTEHAFRSPAVLIDRRHRQLNTSAPRQLKAERNKGRATFFVLLIVLFVVIGWLYLTINPEWP